MSAAKTPRPTYRNIHVSDLLHYRLPLPGIVSILHRISGVLIFILLGVLLGLLHRSLASEAGFAQVRAAFAHPLAKLFFIVVLWAYLHHFFAGLRYLWLDVNSAAMQLDRARRSSIVVLTLSIALTLLMAIRLWW